MKERTGFIPVRFHMEKGLQQEDPGLDKQMENVLKRTGKAKKQNASEKTQKIP